MQLITAFTEPSKLFTELKQKPNFLLPLLLTLVTLVVLWLLYYQRVDGAWLIDQMAASAGSPAKEQAMRKALSIDMLKWSTLIAGPVVLVVIYLISALYYKLVGKMCGIEQSYKAWLSFTSWAAIPALLAMLVGLIQVFIASPQTAPADIMLTHLDPLFVSLPVAHPWKGWLSSFDLLNFWSIGLAAIGWRTWGDKDWGQAITVAALPSVVIYGIWALIVAFAH
ncbi:YIP1 family protein [Chitinimonas naiadis]